jgi:DNA-binding NarL/FixJ family response regulator
MLMDQLVRKGLVTIRVFVVEDLGRMRSLFKDLFSQLEGVSVVATAATEAEARLWLSEHPGGWDLAIVDLILEQGSGMGVISQCRASPRPGKIVVFSSYATPGVRQHCLRLGADAVFDKTDSADFVAYCVDTVAMLGGKPAD